MCGVAQAKDQSARDFLLSFSERPRRELEPVEEVQVKGTGVCLITIAGKTQLWIRVKLRNSRRKHTRFCWACGTQLVPGTQAYSPLTNDLNRMRRLCQRCAEGQT